jgi:DNA-binding ferritin-like protein
MQTLASIYRFLQLFAHAGHHLASGCTFNQDHAFFGELYAAYGEAFDEIVERLIGMGKLSGVKDRIALDTKASAILAKTDSEELMCSEDCFEILLEMEQEICGKIEKLIEGKLSQGTINLLAQLADDSEKRQYKLTQRVASEEGDAEEGDDEIKRAY